MNGYDLSRIWYNHKFENVDKVRGNHSDLFFYIVDLWNRLGQIEKIGLPTSVTMQSLGIGSYNTYKKTLQDLVDFGFIIILSDSKNQYQSKIIAISKIDKALDKALDKAHYKATDEPTDKATDTIIEQYNNLTKEQKNNILSYYNMLSSDDLLKSLLIINNKEVKEKNINHKIDFEEIIKIFNETCPNLEQVKKLSKGRISAINNRIKENGIESFGIVFQNVSDSRFLNGENKHNWKATFDWILNPNNFLKILENNYQNNERQESASGKSRVDYSDDFKRKIAERLQS